MKYQRRIIANKDDPLVLYVKAEEFDQLLAVPERKTIFDV